MYKINIVIALLCIQSWAFSSDGLISVKSNESVNQTTKNLLEILNKKGMTVFKVINHKTGAEKVGKKLRPTTLVLFGNPNVGTLLMQCSQTVGIDLPQKALIWEDEKGQVWYTYNNPQYLAKRHNINACDKPLGILSKALTTFANTATTQTVE